MHHRKILIQVTGPTVLIGLVLFATCLVSAWNVNDLQDNLATILKQNVSSLEAAHKMEISVRQLRVHCFLYLFTQKEDLRQKIAEDERNFEQWLQAARVSAGTTKEHDYIDKIKLGYDRYRQEFELLFAELASPKPHRDIHTLALQNPVDHVIIPCRGFLEENERIMEATAEESAALSRNMHLMLLLLGLGGPLGGILSGFGIAWGLSRSIYRLKVRVQDMAHHLDHDVGSVNVMPDGDLNQLDKNLEYIVKRVEAVMERIQKQQRDLLRAEQLSAVGQLAACVAHEIRNPLTAVKMLVGLALRQINPKPLKDQDLRIIHDEIGRVEHTVQNLLDFARSPQPHPSTCDLREVVGQSVQLVQARAQQQHVDIESVCPSESVSVLVDRGQMSTVLVNLFLNALDAMPHGGKLKVELSASGPEVHLKVMDSGAGIAADIRDNLFTPFSSSKPTGTGLGLNISRGIIEEHGGRIAADSCPEGGARFHITLPAQTREVRHADLVDRR